MAKHCRVVCDTPAGLRECQLTLPDEATLDAALEAARAALGEHAAEWDSATVGVFGRVRERHHVPADGDRIEVYRALLVDPKRRRRERAGAAAQRGKR
jgi:putative ubiquitin-RnfH superfamily antitoxin RatB of RatAB toxin-antitoxin module